MKYLHIIFFLFSFNFYGQITEFNENKINSLLIGKWNIEKVILDGENATLSKAFKNNSIEFFKDKKFIEEPITDNSVRGIWIYNPETKLIELKDNDKIIGTIRLLEKKFMIFVPNVEKDALISYNNYEMHLVKSK